jgi:hypothetical protein
VAAVAAVGTTETAVETAEPTAAIEGAEASRAADSRTRITAIARDSPANRAGNAQNALAGRPAMFWRAKFKEI